MRTIVIEWLECFIWLVVAGLVVVGAGVGFMFGAGAVNHNFLIVATLAVMGALLGLCIAAIVCGPILVLLQMKDSSKDSSSKPEA